MSAPQWLNHGYSNGGPSFSVLGNALIAVWRGPLNDTQLWWSQTSFSNWEGWTVTQWSTPALCSGPNFASTLAPCLTDAVTNADGSSTIAMVWRSAKDNTLWYATYDGKNWSEAAGIPSAASAAAPAATYYKANLIVSWRGVGTDESIYWSVMLPPLPPPIKNSPFPVPVRLSDWTPVAKVPGVGGSSDAPALAASASAAHLFWKGIGTDPRIFYATYDGTSWSAQQSVDGVGTSTGPVARAVSATDTIWLAWKGKDTDARVFYSSFALDKQWSPQEALPVAATNDRPALACYDVMMYIGWAAAAGSAIYWGPLLGISAPTPAPPVASQTFNPPAWTTPNFNTLGGTVSLTVRSNGSWNITFNTTNGKGLSGGYTYQVRAYLIGPNVPIMMFSHSDSIGANVDSDVNQTYPESGTNPLIALYWSQIVAGAQLQIAPADFQISGVLGIVDKVVADLVSLGAAAAGEAIGVVIGLTSDAIGALHINLGPGLTIGVVADALVFVVGALAGLPLNSAVFLATVTGAATAAIASALTTSRVMHTNEIALAQKVFNGTLDYSKVRFTNLSLLNSKRAMTSPGADGNIYCFFGDYYTADMSQQSNQNSYPCKGEMMIHELTHVWQIQHNNFIPGFVCSGFITQANYKFGDNVYRYGPPGPAWSSFNPEQQAAIVNEWFAGKFDPPQPGFPAPQSSFSSRNTNDPYSMDPDDPYIMYIQDNILTESAGYSATLLGDAPGNP